MTARKIDWMKKAKYFFVCIILFALTAGSVNATAGIIKQGNLLLGAYSKVGNKPAYVQMTDTVFDQKIVIGKYGPTDGIRVYVKVSNGATEEIVELNQRRIIEKKERRILIFHKKYRLPHRMLPGSYTATSVVERDGVQVYRANQLKRRNFDVIPAVKILRTWAENERGEIIHSLSYADVLNNRNNFITLKAEIQINKKYQNKHPDEEDTLQFDLYPVNIEIPARQGLMLFNTKDGRIQTIDWTTPVTMSFPGTAGYKWDVQAHYSGGNTIPLSAEYASTSNGAFIELTRH